MSVAAVLVDTHAHVMDDAFGDDRAEVVERATAAGVGGLVLVGYDLATSRAALCLARDIAHSVATVGIHPNSAATATQEEWDELERLAGDRHVSGIGETGLDYYREHTPHAVQRDAFARHLALAEARGLPVIVHNRLADAHVAEALHGSAARRLAGSVPGVLHCFSSADPRYLERMLEDGYYVSFAGPITYKNADELRMMAARVPLERLLVETDCPYLAPVPHRGQRNEPAYLTATAAALASVHELSVACMQEHLLRNSLRVFPALQLRLEAAA